MNVVSLSPVIFIFFSLNWFLNLYNHLLLAVNGLVLLVSGDPLLKCSYKLNAFWHNTLPSIGTYFLFMSSTYKFNAFSILTSHFSRSVTVTFAVWGRTAKLAKEKSFFFLLHNFTDRLIFTMILAILAWYFSFP